MKKLSILLCICIIATTVAFTACKKSSKNNTTPVTPASAFVTATVGSLHFSAKGNEHANGTFNVHDSLGGFLGTDTLLKTGIAIDFQRYKGPGTYSLNGVWNTVFYDSTGSSASVMGAYGTIIITDTTTYIKGTFSCTLIDSTKITDGSFSILKP